MDQNISKRILEKKDLFVAKYDFKKKKKSLNKSKNDYAIWLLYYCPIELNKKLFLWDKQWQKNLRMK